MTFKEAKQAIKELAKGAYHSVRFECSEHENGKEVLQCAAYVADVGWTYECANYEMMIDTMKILIDQKNNPSKKEEMYPE